MTEDLTAQNLDPNGGGGTQYLADMKLVHKVSPEAGAYDWNGNKALFEAGRIAILHDEYPAGRRLGRRQAGRLRSRRRAGARDDRGRQADDHGQLRLCHDLREEPEQGGGLGVRQVVDQRRRHQPVRGPDRPADGARRLQPATTPVPCCKRSRSFVPAVQGIQVTENYYEMLTNIWPEVERAYRGEQTGEEAMVKAGEIVTGLIGS